MSDHEDVRTRLDDALKRAAARAYEAAHGVIDEQAADAGQPRRRWRLSGRAALAAVVALAAVCAAVLAMTARPAGTSPVPVVTAAAQPSAPGAVVHVAGAVHSPGLYTLAPGSRVADAIAAAGGATEEAQTSSVNLARVVVDGEQVRVPSAADLAEQSDGPVSLNSADAARLETLPGIGPVLAERIVADREAHGPFASVADIARVPGVGAAIVAGLDGQATV